MWGYTPRIIAGFMHYAAARHKAELAERLSIGALAAQASGKTIDDTVKKLSPQD